MDPDVLEVDELMSGRRQEGAYAGVTVFVQKLAQAGVMALLPAVLRWSGYVQTTAADPALLQPTSALSALRLVICVPRAVVDGLCRRSLVLSHHPAALRRDQP